MYLFCRQKPKDWELSWLRHKPRACPCLTSADVVPQEAKITDLLLYIPLRNNPEEWADVAICMKKNQFDRLKYKEILQKSKFNINTEAPRMEAILLN